MLKIIGSITAVIAFALFIIGISYVNVNNQEVTLRNLFKNQKGVIEANYDKMWKVISQQAEIPEKAKDSFKEMYTTLIEGRYKDASMMKWIKEQNPQFDWSLYKTLMVSVEALRTEFFNEQKKILSIKNQHDDLRMTIPNKWFLGDVQELEYKIVSSTTTKTVLQSGVEDNISLYK